MVYVGGLEPSVSEEILHAAFIPFGNIREVSIPKDFKLSEDIFLCINEPHGILFESDV